MSARTHCPQNHLYSLENTHYYKGRRFCKACAKIRSAKAYRERDPIEAKRIQRESARHRRSSQGKPQRLSFIKWCEAHPDLPHDKESYLNDQLQRSRADGVRFYKAHKEEHRAYALKKKYGITALEYTSMLAAQNGQCAICGQLSNTLGVDHSHSTRRVRGLLCTNCNTGIGLMGESPERLRRAADYLSYQ